MSFFSRVYSHLPLAAQTDVELTEATTVNPLSQAAAAADDQTKLTSTDEEAPGLYIRILDSKGCSYCLWFEEGPVDSLYPLG